MRHPIWFINLLTLADWQDARSSLSMLAFSLPHITRYLDEVNVKGNADAQALVDVLARLFHRVADWRRIAQQSDTAEFKAFLTISKRIYGLRSTP